MAGASNCQAHPLQTRFTVIIQETLKVTLSWQILLRAYRYGWKKGDTRP